MVRLDRQRQLLRAASADLPAGSSGMSFYAVTARHMPSLASRNCVLRYVILLMRGLLMRCKL